MLVTSYHAGPLPLIVGLSCVPAYISAQHPKLLYQGKFGPFRDKV